MSYIPQIKNKISTLNSVALTPITSGQTWSGVSEDVSKYGRIGVSVYTPFGEVTDGTLWFEVSRDNVEWSTIPRIFTDTSTAQPHMWAIVEKYFRVRYVNGASSATTFQLQTQYSVNDDILLGHPLSEIPKDEHEALLTKSITWGTNPNGDYTPTVEPGYVTSATSNTPLGAGSGLTSDIISTGGYSQITLELQSDQEGSFVANWYSDAAGTKLTRTFTVPYLLANGDVFTSAPVFAPYVQVIYTNGVSAQTEFHIALKMETKPISGQLLGVNSFVAPTMVASLGRNITMGQQPDGSFRNNPHNGVSFRTTTPILSGATYEGVWVDTDGFNSIELFITTDVVSAANGIKIEFTDLLSTEIVRETHNYTYTQRDIDRGYLELVVAPKMVGYRVCYVNGPADQTTLIMQSDLKVNGENSSYNEGGALIIGDSKTEIALGNVPNHEIGEQFGIVTVVDAADAEKTIWPIGNDDGVGVVDRKTFATSAETIYISSTSGSDTSKDITMTLIDSTGHAQVITTTLNGQTAVSTTITGLDCNDAFLSSDDDTLAGEVYVFLGGSVSAGIPTDPTKILSYVPANYGRATQATYRVPLDEKMVITNIYVALTRANGSAGSATVFLRHKKLGGSWIVERPFIITTQNIIDKTEELVLGGGDILEFTIDEVSDTDTSCTVEFEYQLIKL